MFVVSLTSSTGRTKAICMTYIKIGLRRTGVRNWKQKAENKRERHAVILKGQEQTKRPIVMIILFSFYKYLYMDERPGHQKYWCESIWRALTCGAGEEWRR